MPLVASYVSSPNAAFDSADVRLGDGVCRRYVTRIASVYADGAHIVVGESRARMFSLAVQCMPPFGDHVGHVVGVRAEEQVADIDAPRHITSVQDVKSVRDRSVDRKPREAVSLLHLALPIQEAVAVDFGGSCPQDTSALIRGRRIMRQSLRKRPMTRARESLTCGISHGTRFLRCCDQGRGRRFSVARPAYSITPQAELRKSVAGLRENGYTQVARFPFWSGRNLGDTDPT